MENIESIQIQNMAELTEEEIAGITPPSGAYYLFYHLYLKNNKDLRWPLNKGSFYLLGIWNHWTVLVLSNYHYEIRATAT